jgi:hypothetical protein
LPSAILALYAGQEHPQLVAGGSRLVGDKIHRNSSEPFVLERVQQESKLLCCFHGKRGRGLIVHHLADPSLESTESMAKQSLSDTADGQHLPDETDDVIPQTIGRYHVQERLGKGGFGTVYLARDTELDRLVALKVPRPGQLPSEDRLDRCTRR